MSKAEIREAVARGWTHSTTEEIVLNSALAEAISDEIEELFNRHGHKMYLGYCTTSQLITELAARLNLDLNYRTIDKDRTLVSR